MRSLTDRIRDLSEWKNAAWAVAIVAVFAHVNTLGNAPVLDDGWVIFENPFIKSMKNLPRIFTQPYNAAGAATNGGLFRPVTTLTYAINYALGGADVRGYHLVNLGLHVATCLLVLLLAKILAEAALAARAPPPKKKKKGKDENSEAPSPPATLIELLRSADVIALLAALPIQP